MTAAAILIAGGAATATAEGTGTPTRADQTHDAMRVFTDRALMVAADQACGFFNAGTRSAVLAGYWQALGTALRAGADRAKIAATETALRADVRMMGCAHRGLNDTGRHVARAFSAFSRTTQMEYAGTHRKWVARRGVGHGWVATQTAGDADDDMFGLYWRAGEAEPRLAVHALTPRGALGSGKASAARLWLPEEETPNLDVDHLRAPPRVMMRPVWAGQRSDGVWIFPEAAHIAFAELDPRSVALVEILGAPGEPPVRSWAVEVGDYRAAVAFSRIGE